MKIETITYKRVKNLGNYQSETLEATATVEEGEEAHIVVKRLKNLVLEQLELLELHQPAITDNDIPVGF